MSMLIHRTIGVVAVLALSAAVASGQGGDQADLAGRTFQNAEQLMREGKREQALKDYQQVIQAFPDSRYADDALVKVGAYYYPAETIWDLGAVDRERQEAGRRYFEQVRESYPQTDSAPYALYKLGLLAIEPESTRRDLDAAYASFYGVVNIYPGSEWGPQALRGAAASEIGKKAYDNAILSLERALEAEPRGAGAADTRFLLGLARVRKGAFARAAEEFQASRLLDPDGATAGRALDWLTLVYNLRLRESMGGSARFAHDPGFVPRLPDGKDLRGELSVAVSGQGELMVVDPRRAAILTFGQNGEVTGTEVDEGASLIAFDAFGARLVVDPGGIRVSGKRFQASRKDGSDVEPVEEIGGAMRNSKGRIFVLDVKEGEILRYESDPQAPAVIHSDKEGKTRILAMASGPEDRLHFLDRRDKRCMTLEGGVLRPLAARSEPLFQEPVGIAVDNLGDIYVADARQKAVIVLDPEGREIARISPPAGTPAELTSPAAVAVGPRGEVYVYDDRKRTILRFL